MKAGEPGRGVAFGGCRDDCHMPVSLGGGPGQAQTVQTPQGSSEAPGSLTQVNISSED